MKLFGDRQVGYALDSKLVTRGAEVARDMRIQDQQRGTRLMKINSHSKKFVVGRAQDK